MEEQDEGADDGPASLRVVLDTNVLYPPYLRDTLLLVAEHGLYLPIWSGQIIEELRRKLLALGLTPARVEYLIATMRLKFPEAEHSVSPVLTEQMTNALEDRHVAALAVAADADVIVTFNRRDFPPASLAPSGITVHLPDQFLVRLHAADPELVTRIVIDQPTRYRRPAMSFDDLLNRLTVHAPAFVTRIVEAAL